MIVEPLTARRLAATLGAAQVAGRLPGVVAAVVRDGELAWTSGDLDLQHRVGSITKTMTAVLVLQLRDEGLLSLTDPLGKHLPGIPYGDRTLRSLLAHDSGVQSEPRGAWWERSPGVSFDELVAAIEERDAPFEPGTTYHYSNLGFALLGEVVSRLRGESWWACVQTRVLEPLGLTRTTYDATAPHAQGYSVHPYANTLTAEPHQDTGAMAPAGQVWSTAGDLACYATCLLDGHPGVLERSTLVEMSGVQAGGSGLDAAYGLGLRLLAAGHTTRYGHTGSMPGFQASLFVDPVRRTGAVVLANSTTGLLTEEITPALLETLEASEPTVPEPWRPVVEVPPAVAEILGLWHWGNTGFLFSWNGREVVASSLRTGEDKETFALRDGQLVGTGGYHHGELLHVVRNGDGTINHLVAATFVYTRQPYDPAAPIPGGTS